MHVALAITELCVVLNGVTPSLPSPVVADGNGSPAVLPVSQALQLDLLLGRKQAIDPLIRNLHACVRVNQSAAAAARSRTACQEHLSVSAAACAKPYVGAVPLSCPHAVSTRTCTVLVVAH